MNVVYEVVWTEMERGWGSRPISRTLYPSKSEADRAIKTHWDEYPDGFVPDYYIHASEPRLIEVSAEVEAQVRNAGSAGVNYPL